MRSIDDRYLNDPEFHQLVDMIYNQIVLLNYTPTETREACMMAQIKYEMNHPRPIILSKDLENQLYSLYRK